MPGDVRVRQVVAGQHRHACGLEHPAVVHLVACRRGVLDVHQLLGLDQDGVEVGTHHDHHIVVARINVLEFHLRQGVQQGCVQLGGVLGVGQGGEVGDRTTSVACGLASGAAGVSRVRQTGGLDGLDQEGLILELGDFLALLTSHFAAGVHLRLEHVQHREELAGSDHRVHGHRSLGEVGLDTIRCNAGRDLLERGLAHGMVGERSRTLDGTHGDVVGQDGTTIDGAFDHAGELLDNEGHAVGLGGIDGIFRVRKSDVGGIECHKVLLVDRLAVDSQPMLAILRGDRKVRFRRGGRRVAAVAGRRTRRCPRCGCPASGAGLPLRGHSAGPSSARQSHRPGARRSG